jgi:hypothetical protein
MPHPIREWQAVAGKAPSAPRFRPFFSACSTRLSRDLTATWEAGRPFLGVGFTYENARHIFVADNDEGSHSVMYVVRSLGLGTRSSVLRPVFFQLRCGSRRHCQAMCSATEGDVPRFTYDTALSAST